MFKCEGSRGPATVLADRGRSPVALCKRKGMKQIVSDTGLVAYCGLYCGACRTYLRDRCPGCHGNDKATWCKVRSCCIEHEFATCAECDKFPGANDCRKFNNFLAKLFGFVFRSDRSACIQQIRQLGIQGHADDMAAQKRQAIRR